MWLGYFLRVYWRTLFLVFYPLTLLFIFFAGIGKVIRCLYIILLIIGYWVTEVIPTPVTGFIPMIFFPCFTLLDSKKTSRAYLEDTNFLFLAALMIAVAIEYCGLHKRIALGIIYLLGSGVKKISFGIMLVTMLISMWFANTAATAMMCPVVGAILEVLEKGGVIVYVNKDEIDPVTNEPIKESLYKPSDITKCYYLLVAYSSSIGGIGTIVGTGVNVSFIGIFLGRYPEAKSELSFLKWMGLCLPIIIVSGALLWVFMITFYLGFLRPKSKASTNIKLSPEQKEDLKASLKEELDTLGPMSYKEINITIIFILVILLWFFKTPYVFMGWAELISKRQISDASVACIAVVLIFMVPSTTTFMHVFDKDVEKRPKKTGPALCSWVAIQQNVPWGVLLLIGSSFAIAEATKVSGLSTAIGDQLNAFKDTDANVLVLMSALTCCIMTQFLCNIIVCNITTPIIIELAIRSKINPLHLCLPCAISFSLAFLLPASTPPNAIVQAKGHLSPFDFLKAGIFVTFLVFCAATAISMFYGGVLFDGWNKNAGWAVPQDQNKTKDYVYDYKL